MVFGASGDPSRNGGVMVDYVYGTDLTLGNGEDELVLSSEERVIDEVVYSDDSPWVDPGGASLTLAPSARDASANDDPTSWCEAVSPYGEGDLGTPGAANDRC